MASNTFYLSGTVVFGTTNPTIGILPANAWVERAGLHVVTAFNSDGSDNIKLGHATDDDAYFTNEAVNATGRKTVTLGAGIGFDSTSRIVDATYTAGGSTPTTGKAKVWLEYLLLDS